MMFHIFLTWKRDEPWLYMYQYKYQLTVYLNLFWGIFYNMAEKNKNKKKQEILKAGSLVGQITKWKMERLLVYSRNWAS